MNKTECKEVCSLLSVTCIKACTKTKKPKAKCNMPKFIEFQAIFKGLGLVWFFDFTSIVVDRVFNLHVLALLELQTQGI